MSSIVNDLNFSVDVPWSKKYTSLKQQVNDYNDAQPGETEVRFPALFRAMDFVESSLAKIFTYLLGFHANRLLRSIVFPTNLTLVCELLL